MKLKLHSYQNIIAIFVTLFITIIFQFIILHNVKLFVSSDSAIYAMLADRFANGQWDTAFHIWWQPFFPTLGGLVKHVVGDTILSLYTVSFLANVLVVIPLYLVTFQITKKNYWAMLTSIFVVANYNLVSSIPSLLTENLYIFLLITAILMFYLYLTKKQIRYILISSIFFAFSYLTRSESVLFYLLSILYLIGYGIVTKKYISTLKSLLLLGAIFLLFISPYLFYFYTIYNSINLSAKSNAVFSIPPPFILNENKTTTFAQSVWSIDTPDYHSQYFTTPANLLARTDLLLSAGIERTQIYFQYFYNVYGVFFFIVLLFTAVGIYYFFIQKIFYLPYIATTGFFLLMLFLPQAEHRYVFWVIPLVFLHVSAGLYFIYNLLPQKVKKVIIIFTVTLFFLLLGWSYMIGIPEKYVLDGEKYQLVGEYLRKEKDVHRIMNRVEAYSYYSGEKMIYTPNNNASVNDLHNYIKLWKVDRLIADRDTLVTDPYLNVLLDIRKKPDWLTVDKIFKYKKEKIIIYKVNNKKMVDKLILKTL